MTDSGSPRRYWNGSPGNRHDHHNVWVVGGKPQVSRAQAAKESASDALATAFGGRRGSDSSVTSNTSISSSNSNNNGIGSASNTPKSNERKASFSGNGGLFQTLSNQKRSNTDQNLARRRQSWNEQAVGGSGGFFSKWWDGYLRGQ
ncbi:hypothetical protein VTN00DRAFT_8462 [Thermoascus crustaceus]|uniref:uncharacterized protein n=1 Tax=Thermoascus crustaceus TaxID=5088 RepID=UPI003744324E